MNATTPEKAHQRLLRAENPHLVEIDWPYGGGQSRFTFEIAPHEGGSLVTLRHELIENSDEMTWWLAVDAIIVVLYNLRSYVETGTVLLQFDLRNLGTSMQTDVTIQAPKDDVWAALTVPDLMDKWVATGAKVELREGGVYDYGWGDGPRKILELKEGEKLVTDWVFTEEPETTVIWTVEGSGGQTTLTVSHSGFASPDQTKGYVQGWSAFLGAIAALAERRDQVEKVS